MIHNVTELPSCLLQGYDDGRIDDLYYYVVDQVESSMMILT